MTIIVGIATPAGMYIGGDRGASDTKYIEPMDEPKVALRGQFLMGYSGNIGVGQTVMHEFEYPDIYTPDEMHSVFRPALRSFVNDAGIQTESYNGDDASFLLFLTLGNVYVYSPFDHSLVQYPGHTAIGSGAGVALGSLYTTEKWRSGSARVVKAIQSACYYQITCMEPIDVLTLEWE